VLQCVAACCSVLQRIAVSSAPRSVTWCCSEKGLKIFVELFQKCSVLQCVAVCRSVSQRVAVFCSVMQIVVVRMARRSLLSCFTNEVCRSAL